jgi:hypothetical protein
MPHKKVKPLVLLRDMRNADLLSIDQRSQLLYFSTELHISISLGSVCTLPCPASALTLKELIAELIEFS